MNEVTNFKNSAMQSLAALWPEVSAFALKILGAFLIVIAGRLITRLVVGAVKKILKLVKAEQLDQKLNTIELYNGHHLKVNTIATITKFIKWMMYIILLIMVLDLMGLEIISHKIGELLAYLPQFFSALVIFVLGLLFANFVKNGLQSFFKSMELSGGKIISQCVFILVLTFITITALNQAGVNTDMITTNISMILAAFLLAFAIAFGLGAKTVVEKLTHSFYARKMFEVGQSITFQDREFTVEEVKSISVVLKDASGRLIVPIKELMNHQIQIKN